MRIIKYLMKNIYIIILLMQLLLFGRLFSACYQIHNLNYGIIILVYFSTLLLYWFYTKILKKLKVKVLFTGVILIIFSILSFYHVINLYAFIYNNFFNNFLNIRSEYLESSSINFDMIIPFLVIIIPVTIFIIFSLKVKIPFITLIITLPIMYLFWYNDCSTKLYTNIYIALNCFEVGINIYFSNLKKAKNNNYKFLIPINNNIIYIAIMVALTATFTGFAGEVFGVKSIQQFNNDRMIKIINEVDSVKNVYGISYSGYGSNSSKLGGPIKINYNLALKVKSSKPMYLRGNVLDNYDGIGWSKSSESYYILNSNSFDKAEKSEKIQILPQTLNTSTFLAPLNTFNIVSRGSNIMYNTSNVFIVGDKNIVESPYVVEYALTEDKGIDNDETYGKEVNEKYKKYLQLPENITPETYNLVKTLMKDCKSNEEKINKINKYLLENYKYSLEVTSIPKDSEFLDYFLFKEKKGYCTYFATAATIFARIAGVPARFVEGFSMDNTKDSEGIYLVGNNRAHAWSEILTSPSDDSWKILDSTPDFPISDKDHKIIMPKTNSKALKEADTKTKTAKSINVNKAPIIQISYLFIIYFISSLLFLLFLGVVFMKLRKWKRNKNKVLGCEGVIPLYYYSKKRLTTVGIKWSATLSDEEGALGLKDGALREHFINIVKVFYEEYYGGAIDASFDKLEFYKYLEGYVKKNSSFLKYYYNKIFISRH